MLDLKIVNGKVVSPEWGVIRAGIGVKDGKVSVLALESPLPEAAWVLDAKGRVVLPGFIDPHIHLGNRSPYEEECVTETHCALAGGVTTVGCYLRSRESYLGMVEESIRVAEERISTDIIFHLALNTPEQVAELPEYTARYGITSFKMYLFGVPGRVPYVSDALLLAGLRQVAALGPPAVLCVHAENAALVERGLEQAAENGTDGSLADWAATHPQIAEAEAVTRAAFFARQAGAPVYVVHLTTKEAVEVLKGLRRAGSKVYVETTSISLSMTDRDDSGLLAKRFPPLRGAEAREALWDGVRENIVDTFGTDNITETLAGTRVQEGMWRARGGFTALGTHLPVLLHEGYHRRGIPLETLVEKGSTNPARIFGVHPRKGSLQVGSDADLVVVDLNRERKVDHRRLHSFGDFSPYNGRKLRGWPVATVKGGRVAVENGKLRTQPGSGSYLRRSLTPGI